MGTLYFGPPCTNVTFILIGVLLRGRIQLHHTTRTIDSELLPVLDAILFSLFLGGSTALECDHALRFRYARYWCLGESREFKYSHT